jgi:hypothetical protein
MNTRTFLAAGREIKKEARYLGRKTLEHPLKATAGGLDPLCAWAIHGHDAQIQTSPKTG